MRFRFGEKVKSIKLPNLISQSVLGMLLLVVSLSALAETTFTYQGRLSQSGEPANGIYDMRFNLFDAVTAGSLIGQTVNQTGVKVLDGVFNVMLDFGDSPFGSDPRWLRIEVKEAGGGAYVALFPRQRVGASPFAIETLAVADGAIDTAALQDNAVTTTKIADGNVFTNDLANYAVSTIKLSNEAVTRTKVANDAIGTAQIEDGTILPADIAGGLYSNKGDLYVREKSGIVGSFKSQVTISCDDDNDLLVLAECNPKEVQSALRLVSKRLSGVHNELSEATLQCRMVNDSSVPEEYFATVYCIDNP